MAASSEKLIFPLEILNVRSLSKNWPPINTSLTYLSKSAPMQGGKHRLLQTQMTVACRVFKTSEIKIMEKVILSYGYGIVIEVGYVIFVMLQIFLSSTY